MNDLLEPLVADLRAFSAEMLEAGLSPTARGGGSSAAAGIAGVLLETVRIFGRLVPALVEELEETSHGDVEEIPTRRPFRARPSRRPFDIALLDERPVPRVWLRTAVVPTPPEPPLRWLLHIARGLEAALDEADLRHRAMEDDVRAARVGGLGWTIDDEPLLKARRRRLRAGRSAIARARTVIAAAARGSLSPVDRPPHPFPRGRAWDSLRRMMPRIEEPWGTPEQLARHLLSGNADVPDLPFLYQRWCALQVHLALLEEGFRHRGNVVSALYAAGLIRYVSDRGALELWTDPRLVAGRRHPSGLTCVHRREVTPDLLLVAPGPSGEDAYVLDATLATGEDALRDKGSYLERIGSFEMGLAAGVPTSQRRPLRAWAVAPFRAPHCRILDGGTRSGRIGAVPLDPRGLDRGPLRAFLADLKRHAEAWMSPGWLDRHRPRD